MTNEQADGDLISRQDAISKIREMAKWHTGDAFNADRVIQHLKQLPSVAIPPAEPKTGHREYNDIYDHYLCGNCKTVVMDYDNYCPNCGARMVEPQERSE